MPLVRKVYPKSDTPLTLFSLKKKEGKIALEMEVEGDNLPNFNNKMWTSHTDGSLRYGGLEYVNNGPLPEDKIFEALKYWEKRIIDCGSRVISSDRTSVHVHMNMQDKTIKQILQGCVAYYVMENALIRHCGPNRVANLFCLPLKQSKAQLNILKHFAGDVDGNKLRTDSYRYSALNLMALPKFGSIEHRGMRGYYDPKHLTQWSTNLNRIFDIAAKDFNSPVQVFDHYYGRSFTDFLGTFLEGDFVDVITKIKDWDVDKKNNMSLLGPFIYETDFDKERPKKEEIVIADEEENRYRPYNFTNELRIPRENIPEFPERPPVYEDTGSTLPVAEARAYRLVWGPLLSYATRLWSFNTQRPYDYRYERDPDAQDDDDLDGGREYPIIQEEHPGESPHPDHKIMLMNFDEDVENYDVNTGYVSVDYLTTISRTLGDYIENLNHNDRVTALSFATNFLCNTIRYIDPARPRRVRYFNINTDREYRSITIYQAVRNKVIHQQAYTAWGDRRAVYMDEQRRLLRNQAQQIQNEQIVASQREAIRLMNEVAAEQLRNATAEQRRAAELLNQTNPSVEVTWVPEGTIIPRPVIANATVRPDATWPTNATTWREIEDEY